MVVSTMPELPEVETVRRSLATHIEGARIIAVEGQSINMRRPLDVAMLKTQLIGRQFVGFFRRGKYLMLYTRPNGCLLMHLGMSARLLLVKPSQPVEAHSHLKLRLNDDRELRFVDPRRFGFAVWLNDGEEDHDPSLSKLGPEPLGNDLEMALPPRLKSRRASLKSLLLNQEIVAGVGNIYATEALWRAGIKPTRKGANTSISRLKNLATHIREVLLEAIDQGGTTLRDYANLQGFAGYFAVQLAAYGRQGLGCKRCGSVLKNTPIGGRATVWCTNCQR